MSIWPKQYLLTFLYALLLSYAATVLVAMMARKLGIMDRPGKGKIHKVAVPRLGGLAIFLAFVLGAMWGARGTLPEKGVLLGGGLVFIIGAIDDIRRVPATVKLLSLVAATLILSRYGVLLEVFRNYPLDLILTVIWVVGVTSAFNGLDNMNGLAAGIAFLAAACYFFVGVQTHQYSWSLLSVALMGSTVGFLRHNFKPGRIFMGDSGSFFLGFTLAAMGVMGGWSTNPVKASIIPILVLGVPIFDLSYVVVARRGSNITHGLREMITFCGADHFSHRLVALGLSERKAVLFIYLVAACVGMGAVVMRNARPMDAILLLTQFVMVFLIIIILMLLGRRPKPREG